MTSVASKQPEFADVPYRGEAAAALARKVRSLALISSDSFCILNFRSEFIVALVQAGIRVYALARHDPEGRRRIAQLGAVPVDIALDPAGMNPWADARALAGLARTLRSLKPDATFYYFTKALIYGGLAARLAKVRHQFAMVSGLGFAFSGNSLRQRLSRGIIKTLARSALRCCHRVIFENTDDLGVFVDRGIIAEAQSARVKGSGVNTAHFRPAPHPERLTFCLIGRMLREKGVLDFISAAPQVSVAFPATRFLLIGGCTPNPGSLSESELSALASDGGVEWVGQVADVRTWIEASSVAVLPSRYREGLPRSLLEAMAMGRPIIVTDVPGCREAVRDDENGFLIPPRDVGALANAMLKFAARPELVRAMGAAGTRLVDREFEVGAINARIFALMARAIASGASHAR